MKFSFVYKSFVLAWMFVKFAYLLEFCSLSRMCLGCALLSRIVHRVGEPACL